MNMQLITKFFSPLTGNSGQDPKNANLDPDRTDFSDGSSSDDTDNTADETEHKSFKTSLRDALQEWSNDDARDIAEDDSTPLRSGL